MEPKTSYKEIAKSTGIFGSSQLINVLLGIIRSKLTAVFLGAAGVGILGIFQSIIDFNRSVSGLGLDTGAVKELATSNTKDADSFGKTIYTINAWYLLTAILGALICFLFARPIGLWVFDSDAYTWHVALLSVAVFFTALAAGITAILQGMRKIPFMALASTIGSLISLLALIPIYYFWGMEGIIPMFILAAFITFSVSFFFYKKLKVKPVRIPTKEMFRNGSKMLRLGLYMVLGGIISTGSLLIVKAYVNNMDGLQAAGLFHVAWITSALFWGIVLRSANTDFFPKLCSLVEEKTEAKRFVNEQTHFVLLLISPIIIGLIVFPKYVIQLLFTSEFITATNVLQWHLMAAFFKIAITPMAYIMLAKGKGALHLTCEVVFWGVYLIAGFLLYPAFNIEALGIAYLIAYIVYIPVVLLVGYRLSNALWDGLAIKLVALNSILFATAALSACFLADYFYVAGVCIMLLSALISWYYLRKVFSIKQLSDWFKKHFGR